MRTRKAIPNAPTRQDEAGRHKWFLDHLGMDEDELAFAIHRAWDCGGWFDEYMREDEDGAPIILIWSEITLPQGRVRECLPINLGAKYCAGSAIWMGVSPKAMAAADAEGFVEVVEVKARGVPRGFLGRDGIAIIRDRAALPTFNTALELFALLRARLPLVPNKTARRQKHR